MKTIFDVLDNAKAVRALIDDLRDKVDIYETVANRARRLETIDCVSYDLSVMEREIKRHCAVIDHRRVSIQQLDKVAS